MTSQRDYLAEDLLPGMKLNLKNRGAASLAVTLVGSLIGLGLLTAAVLNNDGLSFKSKENLLAQVSSGGIQVDFPSSGSILNVGQTYTISWSGIDYSKYSTGIQIQLFRQGNTSLLDLLIADLPQSFTNQPKSYNWTVPKLSDGQYYIKIYCITYCGSKTYADSQLFNIVNPIPTIKVLSPNGGETWEIGKTQFISWQVSDPTAPVGVYLSAFDEFGGTYIAETILPGTNIKAVSWVVPSTVKPGKYLIRAVANPNDKAKSAEDSSDAPLTIIAPALPASIKVLSPNGGETWKIGTENTINWETKNFTPSNVKIYLYSPTLGNIDLATVSLGIKSSLTSYLFQVGNIIQPGQYKITICDENQDNPAAPGKPLCDSSDVAFTIVSPTIVTQPFTVTFPTNRDTLTQGSTYNLTWVGGETDISSYAVYLVGGSLGSTGSRYLGQSYLEKSGGILKWTVPSDIAPGSSYQIQFSGKGATGGNSDSFTITAPTTQLSSIKVLSPNGGETMQIGNKYNISITHEGANFPEFGINLFKGGTQDSNILGSIEGNGVVQYGTYGLKNGLLWDVGKYGAYSEKGTQTASPESDYYICLLPNVGTRDCSDAPFTITVPVDTFKIISPSAGEQLTAGQNYTIRWSGYSSGNNEYSVHLIGGSAGSYPGIYLGTAQEVDKDIKGVTVTIPSYVSSGNNYQIRFKGKAFESDSNLFTITTKPQPPPPPPPPTTLTCDATAKAILDSVGGCRQLDSSRYPNVYKACCTLVTKETLLDMLEKALQDGRIDEQEKAGLLRALDNYLSSR